MENVPLTDHLILRFFPHFLYRGKYLQSIADVSASILHLASPKDHAWKFMDYLTIKKASILQYRGTVKQIRMLGEFDPKDLIFEVVKSHADREIDPGDVVLIAKKDLTYFVDGPRS